MKDLWKKLKVVPVIMVKVKRNTKENISKCTIQLDWKGLLKILLHRKIMVLVQYDPLIIKGKMSSVNNGDRTSTFTIEPQNPKHGVYIREVPVYEPRSKKKC